MSLKARPKQTTAEAKAREIIQKLGISSPDEIDVYKIAALRKIRIRERPLKGCDGMMVRKGDRVIISVRESIADIKKKRFVIAHELGHVLLHPHIKQSDNFSISEFERKQYQSSHPELEANYFAAELLMPESMFSDEIDHSTDPSFREIERLAHKFNTSLSATAIQYVKYNSEPCAFVTSKDLMNPWFFSADDFGFRLEYRKKIHAYTCAHEVAKNKMRIHRDSKISAGTWLQGYSDTGKDYITEESLALGDSGIIYTLLWIHEAI
jgi:Zn-dependent peptidase ImmA (M78 family)